MASHLLEQIESAAGGKLTRRDDLALLLALSKGENGRQTLEDLSFHAKAARRIHGIMERIGRDGEGYDKLEKEFALRLDRTTTLLSDLLRGAPADVAGRLQKDYLGMTPGSLQNLLALMYDLSWYKNWMIDRRGRREGGV
jgi:hypothetical protein